MFSKILVANRGEIAVRAFRAATELGIRTVAVFTHEDRFAEFRLKADESYQIGEPGHPVRAYLDVDGIIEAARQAEADAIYPGYGFLSENPDLAEACAAAGITFIGPPQRVLELTGDKARAIAAAREAGLPTLHDSEPSDDVDTLVEAAQQIGFPLFVKAVNGGGGRGMRQVDDPARLRAAIIEAQREAESAFGDNRMYIEQAVVDPRHIEVQVLADGQGGSIHLYERDCSLQRRHQKVLELAPAPNLDPELRDRICADALRFIRHIDYVNAGTVEFLLSQNGDYVFIEMNPRIQVEHTVTEEITGVDLVSAQMRIAAGESLEQIGLSQEGISIRGAALQCRITTEDPANGFRPDTGTLSVYRTPGGVGVRLDGGVVFGGATVGANFDSLLVKMTCRGRDLAQAAARAFRALNEFRIRGVSTNIPFLEAVIADPEFLAGHTSTGFIDARPELLRAQIPVDRATKLLTYLAEVSVNRPNGPGPVDWIHPRAKLPVLPDEVRKAAPPAGSRSHLLDVGPARWAADLRSQQAVGVTDTTFRDAHQSLLATRIRTRDLLHAAPVVARTLPQLLSVEAWGGATYDVALRFLKEDPWDRLDALHAAMPNLPIQMLLRGRNTVGYTPYPLEVTHAFVAEAARSGVDVFRIFDSLNNIDQIRPAIEAVLETDHAVAEATMCYTGNMTSPDETLYTLDYYLRLAEQLVESGAHVIGLKDMAGLLRAPAAAKLVTALRSHFDVPVHLHTHDSAGGQLGTLLAAIGAGVDAVDVAAASMAGTSSQVSMSALVAALEGTERDTGLSLDAVTDLEPYWAGVRQLYAPFESGLPGPTGRIYRTEIPGGQLSNLRQQANSLGLGHRFEEVEEMYAAANRILGNIVKVTPSSKVVGDLALALVGRDADPADFEAHPEHYDIPDSVIGFLNGDLGTPPGGWPEPFRSKALEGRRTRPVVVDLSEEDSADLAARPRSALNRLLFPGPTREYLQAVEDYSELSVVPTREFLHGIRQGDEVEVALEKGHSLELGISAIGDADDHGMRQVLCSVNGQPRTLSVRDTSVDSAVPTAEKADRSIPGQVPAPFAGVITPVVEVGAEVTAGQQVATIEAMKMEAAVTTPVAGAVKRWAVGVAQSVEGGDLLAVIE
ncbi:pyruvate carboxylase [Acidipropionibacterium virtanenii]|uniref:Pyruvate carboxylase n=1 Tax=Acidipropionibacterium virtanenii TaxID=2057246 RepID=A0A344UPN8_9ACTN|nr:pyruvate carboxylase [Acidipropionibacterium virtanenii]AXE37236.1 Acetyl-/propionyl-coenzyme A carboxylase alpha chain [Acidipropionibacterium virtanenii]